MQLCIAAQQGGSGTECCRGDVGSDVDNYARLGVQSRLKPVAIVTKFRHSGIFGVGWCHQPGG